MKHGLQHRLSFIYNKQQKATEITLEKSAENMKKFQGWSNGSALAILAEDPNFVPRTHIQQLIRACIASYRELMPSSRIYRHLHTQTRVTYSQKHMHIHRNLFKVHDHPYPKEKEFSCGKGKLSTKTQSTKSHL